MRRRDKQKEDDTVPLIEQREDIFAGVDSGIKQKRSIGERLHLPKFNRQKEEIKYGPNRTIYFNDVAKNAEVSAKQQTTNNKQQTTNNNSHTHTHTIQEAVVNKYTNNVVVTSKYTWYSFLPLNMFEQFRKVANFYFLVIAILQLLPGKMVVVVIVFAIVICYCYCSC
jgi:hypothetical protein